VASGSKDANAFSVASLKRFGVASWPVVRAVAGSAGTFTR
jgi:hypothetical protein